MDEIFKQIAVQFPAIGILLYMINRLYLDWRADRDEARKEREELIDLLSDVKHRVERLELDAFGDRSPTHARKVGDS